MFCFYTDNREISEISLRTTATPKTKKFENNNSENITKNSEHIKNNTNKTENHQKTQEKSLIEIHKSNRNEKKIENYKKNEKKANIYDRYNNNYRDKRKNNTFHIDNLQYKELSSVPINQNDSLVLDKNYDNVSQKIIMPKSEPFFSDFYSVTSQEPSFIMKQAEMALKQMNYKYKYVKNQ